MKSFENLQQKPDLSRDDLVLVGGILVQAFETLDHYSPEALDILVQQAKQMTGASRVQISYEQVVFIKHLNVLETRTMSNRNHLSAKGLKVYQELCHRLGREVITS